MWYHHWHFRVCLWFPLVKVIPRRLSLLAIAARLWL